MKDRDAVLHVLVTEVLRTCTADARLALCGALGETFGQHGGELLSGQYYERLAKALLGPDPSVLCVCGHTKAQHIYEEGKCRPGAVCVCDQYRPVGEAAAKLTLSGAAMQFLHAEELSLVPVALPTGGGDADTWWEVREAVMGGPDLVRGLAQTPEDAVELARERMGR